MSDPPRLDVPLGGPGQGRGARWRGAAAAMGPIIGLLILMTAGGLYQPRFLRPENLVTILDNCAPRGLVAIGLTFVILSGGIDLSVGSIVALSGAVGIWLMNCCAMSSVLIESGSTGGGAMTDLPFQVALARFFASLGMAGNEWACVLLAFGVMLTVGSLLGLAAGVLITKGRIAPFIATLGGLVAFRSLAQTIMAGRITAAYPEGFTRVFTKLGNGGLAIPSYRDAYGGEVLVRWPILVFIAVAVIAHVVLTRTKYGRYVVAIGCGERAARYSAVPVTRVKLLTYSAMGALCGLAAMLECSDNSSVGTSYGGTGSLWELDAIAAVVIGGARLSGGRGRIWGTLVGVIILGVINNLTVIFEAPDKLQGMIKGTVIVTAVLIQRERRAP